MSLSRHQRWSFVAASVCAFGLAPAAAQASNMTHPRTPVVWNGGGGECELPVIETPCMTLHDRSVDPVLDLDYGIPYEDLEVTPDEVLDSRTHQFFAFCQPHSPQDYLPSWITQTDVDAAVAKNLIEAGTIEPSDIMTENATWQDCWFRITEDDARRPISCSMAETGVDWDTSAVPAGAYTIDGYTYEPVFNLWVLRPGVVKVHDGDPDAVGPAAAVTTLEQTPYRDDVITIEGCVDALEGTTYTVSYAVVQDDIQWVEYESGVPVGGDSFAFEFEPPEALAGESGILKFDFVDPENRTYTSYMNENIIVINADNPNGCHSEGGSFIGGPCAEDSGGSGDSAGSDDDSDETANVDSGGTDEDDDDDSDSDSGDPPADGGEGPDPVSCACTTSEPGAAPLFVIAGALVLRRRRRVA